MDKLFTIGYEGRTSAEVIQILVDAGVKVLIDVRRRPVARGKADLSKNKLSELLKESGIDYVHEKDLGTPADIMADLRDTGQYDWPAYMKFLRQQVPALRRAEYYAKMGAAFMCQEADATDCHRLRVAQEVAAKTKQEIVNL